MTTKNHVDGIIDGLVRGYYKIKFPEMSKEKLPKTVFATQPGSGALVYVVKDNGIQ